MGCSRRPGKKENVIAELEKSTSANGRDQTTPLEKRRNSDEKYRTKSIRAACDLHLSGSGLRRRVARGVRAGDSLIRSARERRTVLVYARNAMHVGVMDPIVQALERDQRLMVRYLAEAPHKQAHIDRATGRSRRWISRASAAIR